jgi:phosphoribosylanthranilate isomerase
MAETRVKICGLMRPGDAACAEVAGADFVGVVLATGFGRSLDLDAAQRVLAPVRKAKIVTVRVDDAYDRVMADADAVGADVVQLHGAESVDFARRVRAGGYRVWKAIRVRTAADVSEAVQRFEGAVDGLLLDGWHPDRVGGSGATFAWGDVAAVRGQIPRGVDLIAAGGLNPLNVRELVEVLQPDVVDVSSGVELALGEKDDGLIRAFIAAARETSENSGQNP